MIPTTTFQSIIFVFATLLLFPPAENQTSLIQFDNNDHPQREHFPYQAEAVLHLDISDFSAKPVDPVTQNIIQRFKDAQPADSIGLLEGEAHETLGRIVGVTTDADGRIYLLDQENSEVKIYDKSGDFITTIGSAGQGPGEFFSPKFIALNTAGQVFVSDAQGVIAKFDHADNNFAYLNNVQQKNMDFGEGLAVFDDYILSRGLKVISPTESKIVKSINLESNETTFLGEGYNAGGYGIQFYVSGMGPLEQVNDLVIYASYDLPFIVASSPAGEQKWILKLDNFDPFSYKSDGNQGVLFGPPEHRFNKISNIKQVDDRHFLMQLLAFENLETPPTYQSWLINVETGVGHFISDQLPVIQTVTGTGFFALAKLDYPRVDYYKF